MKEYILLVVTSMAILAVLAAFATVVSVSIAYVQCSTYEGAPTKMMGIGCYVQDSSSKWVTFDSYVKAPPGNVKNKQ